ncbi:MAG TPA: hypothetical protein VME46_09100, partial [Acidimicrobiales bacterium]|nr:hypothetical protein [Acidimicrobiales bacterium]
MSRPWQRGTWSWVRRGARIVTGLVLVAVLAGLAVEVGLAPLARAGRPAPAPVISVSSRSLGRVSPYLFGANLLWPYDADGTFDASVGRFYPAFVDEVKALGVTALRYPAGITSDSFDWQRAIGPERERLDNEPYGMQSVRSKRCCNLDRPVPSTVGPDEFGRLLGQLKAVGTITVNFATGTATEAADWVAYMTAPYVAHPSTSPSSPSYWAALRDKNGHRAPYDVPYWEVGNEQDGPGQFGWRSGRAVSVGDHHRRCKRGTQAVCLYAFGGTTAFSRQLVGRFADEKLVASLSSGRPQQHFYLYYPPVVPGSQTVYVAGRPWSAVHTLTSARAGAHVYAFDPTTGEITFGNGRHGAIPARGAEVTASYESGPHAGFVEFYDAMKRMNPHISVCEAEESN